MNEEQVGTRADGRTMVDLRPVEFLPGYVIYPEGSVLIRQGDTHVLCNVSVEQGVPAWMQSGNVGGGWVTAEYSMLPRATHQRSPREISKPSSRNQEIRRLIGRALRASVSLESLPAITCIVDCDVLQADGGTRTAAVTGGYVALIIALLKVLNEPKEFEAVLQAPVAAVSVGIHEGQVLLDLDYEEDSQADADMNVVMDREGGFIEVQGTAERGKISQDQLQSMLSLAQHGINSLIKLQTECLRHQGIDLENFNM